MLEEEKTVLKYNHEERYMKVLFTTYAETVVDTKIAKVNKHTACDYSLFQSFLCDGKLISLQLCLSVKILILDTFCGFFTFF